MNDAQRFAQEVSAYFLDLLNAERFLWAALLGELEHKNIVTKDKFADVLDFMVPKIKEMSPNHPLGDRRFDTKLLEEISDILRMKPGQPPKPPSWKPMIIEGGKSD